MATNDFKVNVRVQGNTALLKNLPKILQSLWKSTDMELSDLALATVNKMEEQINLHRKRPKTYSGRSNLANALRSSLTLERGTNQYRLSFINLRDLDKQAPYWYVLNYGGRPWGDKGIPGFFDGGKPPMGGLGNEPFYFGQKTFWIDPTKAKRIEGIHYLETSIHWLISQWNIVRTKIAKKVETALRNAERLLNVEETILEEMGGANIQSNWKQNLKVRNLRVKLKKQSSLSKSYFKKGNPLSRIKSTSANKLYRSNR